MRQLVAAAPEHQRRMVAAPRQKRRRLLMDQVEVGFIGGGPVVEVASGPPPGTRRRWVCRLCAEEGCSSQAGGGLRELLPDHDPEPITQIVENLPLQQPAAPHAQEVHVRIPGQRQQSLVPLRHEPAIELIHGDPVPAPREDALPIHREGVRQPGDRPRAARPRLRCAGIRQQLHLPDAEGNDLLVEGLSFPRGERHPRLVERLVTHPVRPPEIRAAHGDRLDQRGVVSEEGDRVLGRANGQTETCDLGPHGHHPPGDRPRAARGPAPLLSEPPPRLAAEAEDQGEGGLLPVSGEMEVDGYGREPGSTGRVEGDGIPDPQRHQASTPVPTVGEARLPVTHAARPADLDPQRALPELRAPRPRRARGDRGRAPADPRRVHRAPAAEVARICALAPDLLQPRSQMVERGQ